MVDDSENSGRKQAGRFRKGESGNPAGKPPGARHRATRLAEELLDGQAGALVQKAVELALTGDTTALKICLDRLLPPRKDRHVNVSLPQMESSADAARVVAETLGRVAAGELSPSEGLALTGLVENYRKALETETLERRITALENKR